MVRERLTAGVLLGALGVALAVRADQPIVENYVGRQIPTAMVARNLDRGSGFLRPTLDTAPFPNRFLVEPPIYAQVVALVASRIGFVRDRWSWPPDGFAWERSGRLVSALMTVLGAWAFWGVVRRREGPTVALVALGSFCCLPVVIRYGRAFQPDAFMVGFVWLGLLAWDEYAATDRTRWAWLGGLLLAIGLTTKVTAAWVLIPWLILVDRVAPIFRIMIAAGMLAPALAWYSLAWGEAHAGGSHANADNAAIWIRTLSPLGWLRLATWQGVGGNLLIRAFTPVGFVLAAAGWWGAHRSHVLDRFWSAYATGLGLAIVALGPKWHHGYYWLIAAPLAAVGIARALVGSFRWGRRAADRWRPNSGWYRPVAPGDPAPPRARSAWGSMLASFCLGAPFVACATWQVRTTWSTPPEWAAIRAAGARIAGLVGPDDHSLLVAPEALLYYADRPGVRLEFGPEAIVRAAGEWGHAVDLVVARDNPLALVDALDDAELGDPADRFGPDPARPGLDRVRKLDHRAGLVADVGRVARRDDPRDAFRSAVRRLVEERPLLRRAGVEILIDEPALFVFDPGRPMP